MAYEVVLSDEADRDLVQIFDYLVEAYITFGDPLEDAFNRAQNRISIIHHDIEGLTLRPYQGTLRSDLRPRLRHVTKSQAVFYFEIDEDNLTVNILAIFRGRQDHQRHMLERLRIS